MTIALRHILSPLAVNMDKAAPRCFRGLGQLSEARKRAETLFLHHTTSQEFRRHHINIVVNYTAYNYTHNYKPCNHL